MSMGIIIIKTNQKKTKTEVNTECFQTSINEIMGGIKSLCEILVEQRGVDSEDIIDEIGEYLQN